MRSNVVCCTPEGLLVLEGIHGRPLFDGSYDLWVRGTPFATQNCSHQLDLNLGQLELVDPKDEGKATTVSKAATRGTA